MSAVYDGSGAWEEYTRYDKAYPGEARCGTVHWAPNSEADYDWSNPQEVTSRCDDWLTYPWLNGTTVPVTCSAWGCNALGHKVWWLQHLPHAAGGINERLNNWWRYVVGGALMP